MSGLTRREVIGGVAMIAAARSSPSLGRTEDDDDLFWDDAEPAASPGGVTARALTDWPRWRNQTPRPTTEWAAPEIGVDTGYLEDGNAPETVTVDHIFLTRMLQHLSYPTADFSSRVIVGVRGASLTGGINSHIRDFTERVTLALTRPDHFRPQCTLLVWDVAKRTISATSASTVCNVEYLYAQSIAKARDTLCNMLPAGLYTYRTGTHRNGTKNPQPGAFRLASPVNAVRCYGPALRFDRAGVWTFRGPEIADNIHSASNMREGSPRFSSAGCQVIPGAYSKPFLRPTGNWRKFRIAAGLTPDPALTRRGQEKVWVSSADDGRRFTYWLISGFELSRFAETRMGSIVPLLRRGAQGERVLKLQRALSPTRPTRDKQGYFGADTQRLLIARQLELHGWADGVLTPGRAREMSFNSIW